MDEDDEILDLFLEESLEHLEGIETDLLEIEKNGADIDVEQVNKVFRAMHTIKGGSSFFGLTKVKDLTHVAESILDRVRKFQLVPTPEIVQSLLEAIDHLVNMINNPSDMDSYDISASLQKIEAVESGEAGPVAGADEEVLITNSKGELIFSVKQSDLKDSENEFKGGPNLYLLTYDLLNDIERKDKTPQEVIKELVQLCYIVESKVDYELVPDLENFEEMSLPFYILVSTVLESDMIFDFFDLEHGSISILNGDGSVVSEVRDDGTSGSNGNDISLDELGDLDAALAAASTELGSKSKEVKDPVAELLGEVTKDAQFVKSPGSQPLPKVVDKSTAKQEKKSSFKAKKPTASENVRVNVALLESLMSLAGELVLARNQLLQASEEERIADMKSASQQVNMVTSQLQEAIMKTRMQPIGSVFNKFNRIVRDLCNDLGKDVKVIIEGESVEMDKTIVESIGDPLTHIIRNSMDHGFETPEQRQSVGKDPKGTLVIRAYHEAGKVVIEILDDGRGVNIEKVSEKAFEAGIVTEHTLEKMSEKEIANLIFMPGFSTADEVTEISGRGVGMDVVLTNLKRLGGTVDLNSREGAGTQLKISLPLTLAIMPSLLVSVCDETFAVPQVNLLQIVRVPLNEIHSKVQHTGSNLVIRFMNELIQLVRAEDFLKEDVEPIDFSHKSFGFKNHLYVLVVAAGELKYGIVVDQTLDSPEIVVKPFGRHLKHLSIYAGATILGSGDIAPIFDLLGIATELNITQLDNVEQEEDEEKDIHAGELQKLLIVQNGNNERLAVPLNNIVRIERISSEDIGSVGSMTTYDYLGKSIALFRVDDVADITKIRNEGKCSVVVFETMGRHLGLLVNEVIDSVELVVDFDETTHKQTGILGSAFIDDHLVLLVDLFGIVAACKPEWVNKTGVHVQAHEQKHKILVIDDSSFFVNQISSFLDEAGYSSVQCMDGKEALTLLRSDPSVSLVLSDIEMPVMDGWQFIEELRADPVLKDLPVLALTSVAGESSREKGLALGFNEYLIKLDREEILQNLKHYLYDNATV